MSEVRDCTKARYILIYTAFPHRLVVPEEEKLEKAGKDIVRETGDSRRERGDETSFRTIVHGLVRINFSCCENPGLQRAGERK